MKHAADLNKNHIHLLSILISNVQMNHHGFKFESISSLYGKHWVVEHNYYLFHLTNIHLQIPNITYNNTMISQSNQILFSGIRIWNYIPKLPKRKNLKRILLLDASLAINGRSSAGQPRQVRQTIEIIHRNLGKSKNEKKRKTKNFIKSQSSLFHFQKGFVNLTFYPTSKSLPHVPYILQYQHTDHIKKNCHFLPILHHVRLSGSCIRVPYMVRCNNHCSPLGLSLHSENIPYSASTDWRSQRS